ncbi:MAG: acetyl-CoA carboxylase biotin carboxyl carrier protein [Bdellovibrionota bacterium]
MNLDILKEIVKVAKDQGVAELKVEGKDYKVAVSFMTSAAPIIHHAPVQHAPAPTAAPAAVAAAAKVAADAGLHIIKSPFVGTFYGSPSPGKAVYVKIGDKVRAGQPLCVLEAMKIMNEIDADIAGEIVEICVENESLVEFGQPLFKIKP